MSDLSDLEWGEPSTAAVFSTATPRKCRRHEWEPLMIHATSQGPVPSDITRCARCGAIKDEARSRRGRNNRSRGNAIEREVCKLLGITRVGQFGGKEDGGKSTDWMAVQVKSGGAYPERIDALLRSLPHVAGQLRGVVHTDTPGAGRKRRMLVTLDLYDFADWYGGEKP